MHPSTLRRDNIGLSYDDIALVPSKQPCSNFTRKNINTSVVLGNHTFDLPVIPANMKCVIDTDMGYQLMQKGYFHIMHRFESIFHAHNKYITRAQEESIYQAPYFYSSVSVGIKIRDLVTIRELSIPGQRPDYITIDVAHGHHIGVKEIIQQIKRTKWCGADAPFVIAGNVSTPEAVIDLENWGADAVKVGIGPGRACTTARQTGFMSPMFTTIQECAAVAKKPIIADGGIRENGDIAKAITAGATMVMVGSLFSACYDSPAKTKVPLFNLQNIKANIRAGLRRKSHFLPPVYLKEYYGSASQHNKGHKNNIEGTLVRLNGNGMTYLEKMEEIKQSLQSAISYAGGETLSALHGSNYKVLL